MSVTFSQPIGSPIITVPVSDVRRRSALALRPKFLALALKQKSLALALQPAFGLATQGLVDITAVHFRMTRPKLMQLQKCGQLNENQT